MGLQIRSPAEQIKTCQFADAGATTSKVPVIENSRVFIPLDSAGAGAINGFLYEGEISGGPKATGQAWAPGQAVYWHPGNGNFTTVSTDATLCGHVLEARASGDTTTGLMAFNSFAA